MRIFLVLFFQRHVILRAHISVSMDTKLFERLAKDWQASKTSSSRSLARINKLNKWCESWLQCAFLKLSFLFYHCHDFPICQTQTQNIHNGNNVKMPKANFFQKKSNIHFSNIKLGNCLRCATALTRSAIIIFSLSLMGENGYKTSFYRAWRSDCGH